MGQFSLFKQSRIDCMTVAVDFSPRTDPETLCVAERRLNRTPIERFKRRSATPGFCAPFRWAGVRLGLAPNTRANERTKQ